jgi:tetratricopeptide (TPR) repeat protein
MAPERSGERSDVRGDPAKTMKAATERSEGRPLANWGVILLAVLLVSQTLACSAARRAGPEIALDPTHVLVLPDQGADGGAPLILMGDEREIFDEAIRRYDAGELLLAVRIYAALIARHGESRWIDLYHHNRGLIFMRLQDYRSALKDFTAALELAAHPRDRRDARFQLGIAFAGMERWAEAAAAFEDLIAGELSPAERVEVHVRAGICHQQAHDFLRAEGNYRRARRLYKETKDVYLRYHPTWAARAQYQLGDLYAQRFAEIRLLLPLERMREDLDEKAHLLLKSQNAFLKAIRLRDRYWALAAGYRIGAVYESFYADLQGAEVPLELDAEERVIYFVELKRQAAPLIKRAVEVYRKNLEMARRVGAAGRGAQAASKSEDQWIWVTKTEESLRKLERLMLDLERAPEDPAAPSSTGAAPPQGTTPEPAQ